MQVFKMENVPQKGNRDDSIIFYDANFVLVIV